MPQCPECGEETTKRNRDLVSGVCNACRKRLAERQAELEGPAPVPAAGTDSDVSARTIDQLVFVGLNGYALALDRDTGQIVWQNSRMKSGYVTLLLDGDRLIVSTNGYIYCLDPLTGKILWNNPLRGYGMGAPTSLLSVRSQSSQTVIEQAAAREAARRRSHAAHAGS